LARITRIDFGYWHHSDKSIIEYYLIESLSSKLFEIRLKWIRLKLLQIGAIEEE